MADVMISQAQAVPKLKEKAEAILRESGVSVSYAYEMFYRQIIAHRGLPFLSDAPNKVTIGAMKEAREGKGKKYDSVEEMFTDLEV